MAAGTHAKVYIGIGDIQRFEKSLRHAVVVMLAGMDEDVLENRMGEGVKG
jgi:hypothetical protein